MFEDTAQSNFLSVFDSTDPKPLQMWDQIVENGSIKRVTDADILSFVIELLGSNISTTFITCPANPQQSLGIKLPYLMIHVKNLQKFFCYEVEILDDKQIRRRYRASNFQTVTRVRHFICTIPQLLNDGWNQLGFNLADFTKRAYGTNYVETIRVSINANCRLKRIYFADRLYSKEELPDEFKLNLPISTKAKFTTGKT